MPAWQKMAPAASVDWCEPNYVHSAYVAEWWNTLSSVPIVVAGLIGLIGCFRSRAERRFLSAYSAIFTVGLGSVAFHGTLLRGAQAADELPMIAAGLVFVYVIRWRASTDVDRAEQRKWQLALVAYALGFAAAYFVLPSYFVFFVWSYAALVATIVIRTAWISLRSDPAPVRKRLFLWSAGSYVGGFALLWVPEHVLLGCDHPLQALQLHAVFHLTSAVGSFSWVLWAVCDRRLVLQSRRQASRARCVKRAATATESVGVEAVRSESLPAK